MSTKSANDVLFNITDVPWLVFAEWGRIYTCDRCLRSWAHTDDGKVNYKHRGQFIKEHTAEHGACPIELQGSIAKMSGAV